MNYIVYNITGKILRTVQCSPASSILQAKDGEFIAEGMANDVTQKIEFNGLDEKGQPVNPRVIDKTPQEIETDNPLIPEISKSKRPVIITNGQWDDIMARIESLEKKK